MRTYIYLIGGCHRHPLSVATVHICCLNYTGHLSLFRLFAHQLSHIIKLLFQASIFVLKLLILALELFLLALELLILALKLFILALELLITSLQLINHIIHCIPVQFR